MRASSILSKESFSNTVENSKAIAKYAPCMKRKFILRMQKKVQIKAWKIFVQHKFIDVFIYRLWKYCTPKEDSSEQIKKLT